ncbi:hypothetical protein [Glutamicibacter sp. MCAF14]|uniref:hypothetical protein n=1 Tax=Glutamicibacter sp. MCAF14 TaxID=3233043 RepID=UPI003F916C7B
MINKTFNSDSTDGLALEVGRNGELPWLNIREFDLENTMFMLAPSDAPALALAILEAAGWPERESTSVTRTILSDLSRVVEFQERATAEAKEQAELEAEALELFNAQRKHQHYPLVEDWDMQPSCKDTWLAVARKAREIGAGK